MTAQILRLCDYKRKEGYNRPENPCRVFVLDRRRPQLSQDALNVLWLINPVAAIALGLMFPGGIDDMGF